MSEPLRLTPETLESLLAGREKDAFAAFVADLYERTGYETEQRGSVVTAVAPDGDRERLLVWTDDRSPIKRLLGTDPPHPDAGGIDAVVSRDRDAAAAAAIAEDIGADHLGTAALHDRLLYAMDRETCRDLCQAHFDRAVEPRPAPAEESESASLAGLPGGRIALAALVVCSLIVLGAAGLPGAMTPDGAATVPGEAPTADQPGSGPVTPVGGAGGTPTPTPAPPTGSRPTIANAIAIDLTDRDGVVSEGDTVRLSATITDADSDMLRVFTEPESFGIERVELTNVEGDLYNGTFVVGDQFPAEDGRDPIELLAEDSTGNFDVLLTNVLGVSVSDETIPTITNATAIDLEDGDRIVSEGDTVTLNATVTDADSDVVQVFADAEPFGAGEVNLTAAGGDLYNGTFVVGNQSPATFGSYSVSIRAEDNTGNADGASTNVLEMNISDETAPTITNATAIDLEDGDGVVSNGDLVAVRASVTDNKSGVRRVDAFPESPGPVQGPGPLAMTDADGDGVYTTTFRVEVIRTTPDGSYAVEIGAIDKAGNVNIGQVSTNELGLVLEVGRKRERAGGRYTPGRDSVTRHDTRSMRSARDTLGL
ncbi:MAG: hypothetical protein ABEH88_13200 [Halobacteriales archaeon]